MQTEQETIAALKERTIFLAKNARSSVEELTRMCKWSLPANPVGISSSTCRESAANIARAAFLKNPERARLLAIVSIQDLSKCIKYLNTIEEAFEFKGYPTEIVDQEKQINMGYRDGTMYSYVIKLNQEWLLSPTLYQIALFIIRVFTRAERWGKVYRGIGSFNKQTPFSVFNGAALQRSGYATYYEGHLKAIKSIGYRLLKNRHTLYADGIEEWNGDLRKTEHGMTPVFAFGSTSGPSSLHYTISQWKIGYAGRYFKMNSKMDILKSVFLGGDK